jgi:hypothetical protein
MSDTRIDRRRLLQAVSASVMGYGLPELLALEAAANTTPQQPQAKQVLVVYEEGGISQMDTWDPKPDAPVDHRTPYEPIATNAPGVQFSSLMPMIAQHADTAIPTPARSSLRATRLTPRSTFLTSAPWWFIPWGASAANYRAMSSVPESTCPTT